MAIAPRPSIAPQPLKPPLGLLAAGVLILMLIAGILWWTNASEWALQGQCLEAGGRWIDGGCQTGAAQAPASGAA